MARCNALLLPTHDTCRWLVETILKVTHVSIVLTLLWLALKPNDSGVLSFALQLIIHDWVVDWGALVVTFVESRLKLVTFLKDLVSFFQLSYLIILPCNQLLLLGVEFLQFALICNVLSDLLVFMTQIFLERLLFLICLVLQFLDLGQLFLGCCLVFFFQVEIASLEFFCFHYWEIFFIQIPVLGSLDNSLIKKAVINIKRYFILRIDPDRPHFLILSLDLQISLLQHLQVQLVLLSRCKFLLCHFINHLHIRFKLLLKCRAFLFKLLDTCHLQQFIFLVLNSLLLKELLFLDYLFIVLKLLQNRLFLSFVRFKLLSGVI